MDKVRVAIIGVGNCASSFVQGVEFYKDAKDKDFVPGLMHVRLGGYHIRDIEFSAAFDIDKNKVGKDLSEAVFTYPNNTYKFSPVPRSGVPVHRGMTHDGLGEYLSRIIKKANETIYGVEKFDEAVANQFYMASDDGPSFLDRLEGSLSISPKYQTGSQIGIESIVDLSELSAVGLSIKPSQSDIDYLYFDSATHSGYPVNDSSYSWLRIDSDHANTYGLELEY